MNAGLKDGGRLAQRRFATPPPLFVSAASLFDSHDAAINMIRRLLQMRGAEVVHLSQRGSPISRAPRSRDADAIAVALPGRPQRVFHLHGGQLAARLRAHQVVVGGGGTIAPLRSRRSSAMASRRSTRPNGRSSASPG
jgi:methylmalonyl-CoA mutase